MRALSSSMLLWCILSSVLAGVHAYSAHQRWVFVKNQLRYKINSAYCAGVSEGKIEDGSNILLWHCDKTAELSEFKWEVDGQYIRLQKDPRYCMSVREGKAGDGSDIILWTCGVGHEYQWRIENEHVKYDMDHRYWLSVRQDIVKDGSQLILWSGHSSGYEFLFDSTSPHIRLKASPSLCVSVRQGHEKMDSGKDTILWGCGPSDSKGQAWELVQGKIKSKTPPSSSVMNIVPGWDSSQCLGVRQGIYKDGANIILWRCEGTEEWTVSNEHIRLKDHPDYCLRVDESASGEGSKLQLWHCDAPDEEDKEGLLVHHATHNKGEQETFHWKFGADGGLRSNLDPRYCAGVSQGRVTDGSKIIMWHCGMSEKHEKNQEQVWVQEGDFIKLKSHPNYCMSVREGKAGSGSDIILWTCANWNDYRWTFDGMLIKYRADPQFHMAVRGGSIYDGSELILWPSGTNPFQWQFDKDNIKLKIDPKLCMSIREGKVGDGANVILWTCGDSDEMQWTVSGDHIVPYRDQSKCLSVREGKTKDGVDMIIWACHDDDPSQQFVIMGDRIRLKHSRDMCVSVRDGHAGDGSDILLWSCDETLDTDDEL